MFGFPITLLATGSPVPVASNVVITGDLYQGETLTGDYDYTSPISAPESGSTYKWYRANDAIGTGSAAIVGATVLTYLVDAADLGKYLSFEVTPSDGTHTGEAVASAWSGPITVDPAIFDITIATFKTKTGNLGTLSGGNLNATSSGVIVDQTGKNFYLLQRNAGPTSILKFSYSSLDDLTTGVAYVGSVNLSGLSATLQDLSIMSMSTDGANFWTFSSNGGGRICHCTLSTPWDFSTLTLTDNILLTAFQTNSNQSGITVGDFKVAGAYMQLQVRLGLSGTRFWLTRAAIGVGGSVASLAISTVETPPASGNFDPVTGIYVGTSTATRVNNLGVSPQNGKLYGVRTLTAPDYLAQFTNYVLNTPEIDLGAAGIDNAAGAVVTDDGVYVLVYDITDRAVYCYRNP